MDGRSPVKTGNTPIPLPTIAATISLDVCSPRFLNGCLEMLLQREFCCHDRRSNGCEQSDYISDLSGKVDPKLERETHSAHNHAGNKGDGTNE